MAERRVELGLVVEIGVIAVGRRPRVIVLVEVLVVGAELVVDLLGALVLVDGTSPSDSPAASAAAAAAASWAAR